MLPTRIDAGGGVATVDACHRLALERGYGVFGLQLEEDLGEPDPGRAAAAEPTCRVCIPQLLLLAGHRMGCVTC